MRASLARERSCLQHPLRAPAGPAKLPPPVQGPSKEGGCARSVGALNKKDVRLVACRAGCAPPCRNANSAAQQDLHHDGHLFTGRRREHP